MSFIVDSDRWREIFQTLGRNRLRTFLTACGVFWGIFMLVVMLGAGNGLSTGVARSMGSFAQNTVFLWSERTNLAYQGLRPGRTIRFTTEDLAPVERIRGVKAVVPRIQLGGWRGSNVVRRGAKSGTFSVEGSTAALAQMVRMDILAGRFMNSLDDSERRKIAVVGVGVLGVLFPNEPNPIGQNVEINGVYFTIVGTFKSRGKGEQAARADQTLYVPFSTFGQAFNTGNRLGWMNLLAEDSYPTDVLEKDILTVLRLRHRVSPDDTEAIGSFNAAKEMKKMSTLFTGIKLFIWVVGTFTLLAGLLGVSNIMMIVVRERTKEIGIRKALGARPRTIQAMFVQEALFLTFVAGYGGLVFGVAILELANSLITDSKMFAEPRIDLSIALLAVVILCAGGMLAGFFPARHASKIPPADALRAE